MPRRLPQWPRWREREVLTLSRRKARNINGQRLSTQKDKTIIGQEKALPAASIGLGIRPGEGGHMCHKVNMVQEEVLGQRGLSV